MKSSYFNLSIGTVILRFYLMMAIAIAAGFSGMWWLAIFCLPVLLSIMLGLSFTSPKKAVAQKQNLTLNQEATVNNAAA